MTPQDQTHTASGHVDHATEPPALLGGARPDQPSRNTRPATATLHSLVTRPTPKGWPKSPTALVWNWMARPRPPLPVLVVGAEGGVGTSTVSALVAETVAAASSGPTVVLDQCASLHGVVGRRLVGQRAGVNGQQVLSWLSRGAAPPQILSATATTSAGAYLVDDSNGYTPLPGIYRLVNTMRGCLLVDGGRIDPSAVVRANETRAVLVLVGRADLIGAEAVCAGLALLRQHRIHSAPVVALSATCPMDRRRVQAATKLISATGIARVLHLPHDPRLATGEPLRLDQVARSTATACLDLVARIGATHEEHSHAR